MLLSSNDAMAGELKHGACLLTVACLETGACLLTVAGVGVCTSILRLVWPGLIWSGFC